VVLLAAVKAHWMRAAQGFTKALMFWSVSVECHTPIITITDQQNPAQQVSSAVHAVPANRSSVPALAFCLLSCFLYQLTCPQSGEYSLLLDFLQTVPNIYDDEKVLACPLLCHHRHQQCYLAYPAGAMHLCIPGHLLLHLAVKNFTTIHGTNLTMTPATNHDMSPATGS
jgi:hypothetical protein